MEGERRRGRIQITWNSGHLSLGASAVSIETQGRGHGLHKALTMDVDMLVNGINKTIFATADDEAASRHRERYISDFEPGSLTLRCDGLPTSS